MSLAGSAAEDHVNFVASDSIDELFPNVSFVVVIADFVDEFVAIAAVFLIAIVVFFLIAIVAFFLIAIAVFEPIDPAFDFAVLKVFFYSVESMVVFVSFEDLFYCFGL